MFKWIGRKTWNYETTCISASKCSLVLKNSARNVLPQAAKKYLNIPELVEDIEIMTKAEMEIALAIMAIINNDKINPAATFFCTDLKIGHVGQIMKANFVNFNLEHIIFCSMPNIGTTYK